ncbi:alpha/beta hydrolase [Pseudogemmobacter sp. W21_MBD1_M6]|uniref:alpha/beta hydrolase n=1 Tax=Pseudogemmobacter sp. W21_MBD1_M6 TaxID=3240271 RepID=UPI003F945B09
MTDNGLMPLVLDIYLPKADAPIGTVLYLHPGGFLNGDPSMAQAYTAELLAQGFAVVSAQYRLKRHLGHLTYPFAGKTKKLRAETPAEYNLPIRFIGRAAHTATEDGLAALDWIASHGAAHGLNTRNLMIFGVSAGGILAANIAFLAPALGITRPPLSAVVILSGSLANLAICDMTRGPALLWAHGRTDTKVDAGSAIAAEQACRTRSAPTRFLFIDRHAHGTYLYRSPKGLPGADAVSRRMIFWEFLKTHHALPES